ncbi:hypothetical protein KQI74_11590 [Paenibacillus barcinonensis]|nr:hypothetical protein [Paenibacillus barcinonensis]MBU5352931.1 hypothetical protein [Paenibacillus barcinonensis]
MEKSYAFNVFKPARIGGTAKRNLQIIPSEMVVENGSLGADYHRDKIPYM